MKKILVTGASGFLGGRLAAFYRGKYEVEAPSHGSMDITDAGDVERTLCAVRPDVVIHCAAVSDIGACEADPEGSFEINVAGAENIADLCGRYKIRCVLCSSDQVYSGNMQEDAHRENEILAPVNQYGMQKLCAERSCLKLNGDSVHLRLSWMYDSETVREGEHSDFVRTLVRSLRAGENIIFPANDLRGITYAGEVIKNMEKAWELPGGVYNFGAPNTLSTYEIAKRLFDRLGLDGNRLSFSGDVSAGMTRNLSMSQEKINGYGIFFGDTLNVLTEVMRSVHV